MVELRNGASGEDRRLVDFFCGILVFALFIFNIYHLTIGILSIMILFILVLRHFLKESIGNIVSKRKRSGKKPEFIGETDWIKMLETWDEEEHVKKSKTNSANASSNPDGLGSHRHTSGPVNHCRIAHDMAISAGGVPQPLTAVVRKTHSQQDGTLIDARTQSFFNVAEALAAERSQQPTQTDENSQPSVEQLNAAYIEDLLNKAFIIATTSKGCVYGLGSIQDIGDDPKKSAAASILRNAQADVRISKLEEQVNVRMSKLEEKVDDLLRLNGVDPVTNQPVRRESGGSAPSPRSEASHLPNQDSPTNHHNITPLNLAALTPQNLPQYFED